MNFRIRSPLFLCLFLKDIEEAKTDKNKSDATPIKLKKKAIH